MLFLLQTYVQTGTGTCGILSVLFVSRSTFMMVAEVKKSSISSTSLLRHTTSHKKVHPCLISLQNTQKTLFILPLPHSYPILDSLPHWMAHVGPRQLVGSSARHLTSHTHTCPPPTSITGPHSIP